VIVRVNDLSDDQRYAYDHIIGWMRHDSGSSVLTLGGYAGSGKSTLVSLVAEQVDRPAFVAYTGKASSVLKRKLAQAGVETIGAQPRKDGQRSLDERPFCGTIHSLIYRPCDCREPKIVETRKPCPKDGCGAETLWLNEQSTCAAGHVGAVKNAKAFEAIKSKKTFVYAEKDEDGRCKHCGGKEWLRRDVLDRDYGLIIVDEASMVDDMMLRDLKEYSVPILAVGDHGQLPPVGGAGSLMRSPQLRLEKIHRQAEGNPIVALSKMIREEGRLPNELPGDAVRFGRLRFKDSILEERYTDASPARLLEMGLACYTNRRRVGLNLDVRRIRGTARYGRELPRKGEHVVCLRNQKGKNGAPPIYNGMRGVMASDALPKEIKNSRGEKINESETQLIGSVAFPEDGIDARDYEMLRNQFNRDKTYQSPEELERETGLHSFGMAGSLFDFGYAMTVHKMQGSQYDDLAVCVERPGPVGDEDWRRWLYTATTRAAKKLTILR
jgi:exodeoxyribonuclease-5